MWYSIWHLCPPCCYLLISFILCICYLVCQIWKEAWLLPKRYSSAQLPVCTFDTILLFINKATVKNRKFGKIEKKFCIVKTKKETKDKNKGLIFWKLQSRNLGLYDLVSAMYLLWLHKVYKETNHICTCKLCRQLYIDNILTCN